MTTIPTPVNLDPADTAKIAGLVAREQGLAKMTHDFQTQYEQRAAALTQDMQLFWRGIAEKYNVDLASVVYAPSQDFKQILPMQMRIAQDTLPIAQA